MNKAAQTLLSFPQINGPQVCQNMAVFPLVGCNGTGPEYVVLRDAFEQGFVRVREVSDGGSVPDLIVHNASDLKVLLLDGEEVAGAKQNRILNTTILIGAHTETKIPVSCTEQGRWSYDSPEFSDSDAVVYKKLRAMKSQSVSSSLKASSCYKSDQGEVWSHISELQAKTTSHSPTGAMKDVYSAQRKRLNEFVEAFPTVPNQTSLLVFVNGRAEGLDLLSNAGAYERVHSRLLRSYAMEAIAESRDSEKVQSPPESSEAEAFIGLCQECHEENFPSIGLGEDHRYDGTGIVGSSLVVEDHAIHGAFFRLPGSENQESTENFTGLRQRRNYRRQRDE